MAVSSRGSRRQLRRNIAKIYACKRDVLVMCDLAHGDSQAIYNVRSSRFDGACVLPGWLSILLIDPDALCHPCAWMGA